MAEQDRFVNKFFVLADFPKMIVGIVREIVGEGRYRVQFLDAKNDPLPDFAEMTAEELSAKNVRLCSTRLEMLEARFEVTVEFLEKWILSQSSSDSNTMN